MVLFLLGLSIVVLLLVNDVVLVEVLTCIALPNHTLHIAHPVQELGSALDLFVLVQVIHFLEFLPGHILLGQGVKDQLVLAIVLTHVGTTIGTLLWSNHSIVISCTTFKVFIVYVDRVSHRVDI